MSEPIWCNIEITWPRSWGENPAIRALAEDALANGFADFDDYASTYWNGKKYESEEVDETRHVLTVSGEGNYGLADSMVEDILDWCDENKVPYVARSDTKYEFSAEHRVFDGETLFTFAGDTEQVMLTRDDYNAIVGRSHDLFTSIDDYFEKAATRAWEMSIDHLPEHEPDMEEE